MKKLLLLLLIAGISYAQSGNPIIDSLAAHRTVLNTHSDSVAAFSPQIWLNKDSLEAHLIEVQSVKTRVGTVEDSVITFNTRIGINKDSLAQHLGEIQSVKSNVSTLTRDSIKTHSFMVMTPQEGEEFAMFYAFDNYIIYEVSANVIGGSITINIYLDETCYDTSPVSGIWDQDNITITTSTTNPLSGIGTGGVLVSEGRWVWVDIIDLPEVAATELNITIKYSAQ